MKTSQILKDAQRLIADERRFSNVQHDGPDDGCLTLQNAIDRTLYPLIIDGGFGLEWTDFDEVINVYSVMLVAANPYIDDLLMDFEKDAWDFVGFFGGMKFFTHAMALEWLGLAIAYAEAQEAAHAQAKGGLR